MKSKIESLHSARLDTEDPFITNEFSSKVNAIQFNPLEFQFNETSREKSSKKYEVKDQIVED